MRNQAGTKKAGSVFQARVPGAPGNRHAGTGILHMRMEAKQIPDSNNDACTV